MIAEDHMKRFVGTDRGQNTLFPESLEEWIHEDNPVRVIDVLSTNSPWASLDSTVSIRSRPADLHIIPRYC